MSGIGGRGCSRWKLRGRINKAHSNISLQWLQAYNTLGTLVLLCIKLIKPYDIPRHIPTLKMGKLRLRTVTCLAQGKDGVAVAWLFPRVLQGRGVAGHLAVCGRCVPACTRPGAASVRVAKACHPFCSLACGSLLGAHQACSLFNPAAVFTGFHF